MSNLVLNQAPPRLSGVLTVGDGATLVAVGSDTWPATTRLWVVTTAGTEIELTPSIATTTATWTLTVAQVAALIGTTTSGSLQARLTTGTGDARRSSAAGYLSILGEYSGVSGAQIITPTVVTLASLPALDDLTDVDTTGASVGEGLIFDGSGWVPGAVGGGEGGGATTLDGLTDVATVGAATGEALVYTGTSWAPSAAAAILEGDARLSDARTPTSHTHDDRYYTETETDSLLAGKAASSHTHTAAQISDATIAAGASVSGTNTGDQTLPTWSTISGKPAVVAEGATQADARTAIGAGTSSFDGAYSSLSGKPTLGDAAAKNTGTAAGTVAAGDHNHSGTYLTAETLAATIVDAKGDLIVGTASDTAARLAVGTDNHALVAASGETAGVKYVYVHTLPQTINAQTDSYTLVAGDVGKLVTMTKATAVNLTLPQDSEATFATGSRVDVVGLGAGLITFVAGAGATVNGTPSLVQRAQYGAFTCIKRAANTWLVVGDLAAS